LWYIFLCSAIMEALLLVCYCSYSYCFVCYDHSLSKSIELMNCVKCFMCLFTRALFSPATCHGFMFLVCSSPSLVYCSHKFGAPLFVLRRCMDILETLLSWSGVGRPFLPWSVTIASKFGVNFIFWSVCRWLLEKKLFSCLSFCCAVPLVLPLG